jgi:SAM-dependent methyltransferase
MDTAYAELGRTSGDYWARRMSGRASILSRDAEPNDPVIGVMRPYLSPTTRLTDVGAGAGRYALALAPEVASVIAVEPDPAMLTRLRAAVQDRRVKNVAVVERSWQDAEVAPAEVVLCAHVLYPIEEAEPFVLKLDELAQRACFIALRDVVPEPEPLGRLWLRFHGQERCLQPGYMNAFNLLYELGIHANLHVEAIPGPSWSFANLDDAVAFAREHLILREDGRGDIELRQELESVLVPSETGVRLPAQSSYLGVLWWVK